MNILIIGSKGFIGQHCMKHFGSDERYNVFGCDVVTDYNTENYFLVDSTNSNFHRIFESQKFDACINCSGAASVANSLENPFRDFNLNTKNVLAILDAIRNYVPNCKFVNLSSAAVYGNPKSLPINESEQVNPISPYGIHKKQAEEICTYFNKFYNIPTCSLRIFSAYGSGLKKQLFWDLAKKGKSNTNVELFGTGKESRDFIHVSDIIQVIELLLNKGIFEGQPINVANGNEVLIEDVTKIFYDQFDTKIEYSFSKDARAGDPSNWVADISTIKSLGYTQSISLEEGLLKYIEWVNESS